jgi:hypothetical protein
VANCLTVLTTIFCSSEGLNDIIWNPLFDAYFYSPEMPTLNLSLLD